MNYADAVWQLFLSALAKFLGRFYVENSTCSLIISNRGYQGDLRKVKDMAHMY